VLLLGFVFFVAAPAPPQTATAGLEGTSWQLVKFQSSDDRALTPADKTKYTVAFESNGRVSVRIDCNRGHGTWKSSGPNQLAFGPLALTRAMCPPAPLNDRLAKDWQYVRSYVLKNDHLFLSLMADGGNYEFEPMTAQKQMTGRVKGTATYRERMALPPNAVFESTLEDVSKAGAGAEVIGKASIEHPGNPPIPFEITYDPSRIDPSRRYAVRARILADGKLLFATDQQYLVLTGGHGNEVKLLLRRSSAAGGRPASTVRVEDRYWKLTNLGDAPVTLTSRQKEPHLILNSETRRVSGSGGCNQLVGSYKLNGKELKLSQMAGTMMACIEGMDTERAFLDALKRVTTWRIEGNQLELFDADGRAVAKFETRDQK
jgi:putative lipoprotein